VGIDGYTGVVKRLPVQTFKELLGISGDALKVINDKQVEVLTVEVTIPLVPLGSALKCELKQHTNVNISSI